MYCFSDYFDIKKKKKPYETAADDLKDHLAALDMLIEAFMYFKAGKQDECRFHARGIKADEEEIAAYIAAPPQERPAELRSLNVAKDMKKALEHIRSREDISLKQGIEMPIRRIVEEFALDIPELFMVLMAAAARYDLKYLRMFGFIADSDTETSLNAGVADALLNFFLSLPGGKLEEMLDPSSNLGFFLLLSGDSNEASKLLQHIKLNDEAYRYLLCGSDSFTEAFEERDDEELFFKDFVQEAVATQDAGEGIHLRYVECSDKEDVEYALGRAASIAGCPLYKIKALEFYEADRTLRQKQLFRMRICPGFVLLVHEDEARDDERYNRKLKTALEVSIRSLADRLPGRVIYICGRKRIPPMDLSAKLSPALLKLPLPDASQRIRIWNRALAEMKLACADDISIADIADCHAISYSAIMRLCHQAKESLIADGQKCISRERMQELLFKLDTSDFEHLATEVVARYTWDDIYIENSQKKRLKAACDRYRLRGRLGDKWGINSKNAYGNAVILLMYGPPGTGKTMAAQVIANEVMTPLYRVDVSQIFSKYIGETQKNLSRIFDEAARRNVVLFFDEADALFTRRTEIKDSHDKYANSDTSFLLQKVEEYNGISILATNNFQSFDPAFMRRLSYVVRFERPDEATRLAMWRNMLPETVPRDPDIDNEFLASAFKELTGSNIKSILLAAAYMAGAEDRALKMKDIILAIRYEYEKTGRLIDSDEFGPYAIYMQE